MRFRGSGLFGVRGDGISVPGGWFLRPIGDLVVNAEGFRWRSYFGRATVEMPWGVVNGLDHRHRSWILDLDTPAWRSLVIQPSSHRRFAVAVAEAGYVLHQVPSWPGRTLALRPGAVPDWRAE